MGVVRAALLGFQFGQQHDLHLRRYPFNAALAHSLARRAFFSNFSVKLGLIEAKLAVQLFVKHLLVLNFS